MSVENLQAYDLDFYFEDDSEPAYKEVVIKRVLNDRYSRVDDDTLEVDQMGGTTHFVYFDAEGRKLPKPFLDLSRKERQGRFFALFHLNSSDY